MFWSGNYGRPESERPIAMLVRGGERGCVVDSVADQQQLAVGFGLLAYMADLLLGQKVGAAAGSDTRRAA